MIKISDKIFLTKAEAEILLNQGGSVQFIDVRSLEEFDSRHVPTAENIPLSEIESDELPASLDKHSVIITICGKGGGRSEHAAKALRERGYKAYFLDGGTNEWFA